MNPARRASELERASQHADSGSRRVDGRTRKGSG